MGTRSIRWWRGTAVGRVVLVMVDARERRDYRSQCRERLSKVKEGDPAFYVLYHAVSGRTRQRSKTCLFGHRVGVSKFKAFKDSSYAAALGRLDTLSYQRVKWVNSGSIFISARRPPMSMATNAVMSAIVKRSLATNSWPLSSRSIRSSR